MAIQNEKRYDALMITKEENFCAAFEKWMDLVWRPGINGVKRTQGQFGEKIGLSESQVSNIKKSRRESNENKRREMAAAAGLDYDEMITLGANIDVFKKSRSHQDIIKKFKNKDLAQEINEKLLELESVAPDQMLTVLNSIKAQILLSKQEKEENRSKKAG